MNDKLNKDQRSVVDIVNLYPDSLSEQKRFAAILSDCIPENKALRKALVNAYEEGIIEILRNNDNMQQAIFRCRKKLERNCGIQTEYANSATMIFAYICGKADYFETADFVSKYASNDSKIVNHTCTYKNGTIEYAKTDDGIVIINAECLITEFQRTKTVVVFPEVIDGQTVIGVFAKALNNLRKEKCRMILFPHTLRFIGEEGKKLYQDFQEKGPFDKPIIFLATREYADCCNANSFFSALSSNQDYFCFESTSKEMQQDGFILLKKYQDKRDNWSFPKDGLWIAGTSLDRYTGSNDVVKIVNCNSIGKDVFCNMSVKEIEFGTSVTRFSEGMIHDCNELKSIVFEADTRCNFQAQAIYNCNQLQEIKWPPIMNFEQLSIYHHCPKLGDMIVYRRLLTCQRMEEFVIIDAGIERINNHAFASCENTKIVFIPETVNIVEDAAFENSNIEIVIFVGEYTQWKAKVSDGKDLYVFCKIASNVQNSVSPYEPQPYIHMKNIEVLEKYLDPLECEKIAEICYGLMDKKSDEEMVLRPYVW